MVMMYLIGVANTYVFLHEEKFIKVLLLLAPNQFLILKNLKIIC